MPMRVVIDAVPITGASTAIVTEHLLRAWAGLESDDEIHVVIGPDASVELPPTVHVHRVRYGRLPLFNRLWAQSVTLPRLCRRIRADVVLGLIASTTIAPLPCPRCILVYDMRHELRPEQFLARTILFRRISYRLSYRQARAIACISERTKNDLLTLHPALGQKVVDVTHLGADHTDAWPVREAGPEFAIAFGQYSNKNVDLVLEGWAQLKARGQAMPLLVFGLSDPARSAAEVTIAELGLSDLVTALPWLPSAEFHQQFSSASVVVFPSDFEGFGLPAVEAMALGIPLVISTDAALVEMAGDHAICLRDEGALALADAVMQARRLSPTALADAKAHVSQFTWERSARQMRRMLEEVVTGRQSESILHDLSGPSS